MSKSKFKVGDRVRCVEASAVGHVGQIGHIYVVENADGGLTLEESGEPGCHFSCTSTRFELVESDPEADTVIYATGMPTEAKARKAIPLATGCVDYFPDALAAVAELSRIGNDQHNPGQPLHWDRAKSTDEADALMRHFIDRGKLDSDGVRHSAKVAWRALALLQKEIEASKGATVTLPKDYFVPVDLDRKAYGKGASQDATTWPVLGPEAK